ncbi:phage head completion protein [Enterobacter oligotrophicus]|uniref:phage head completion protein n=1 Tax=Enterobacter oligotrophicus TaxID=2478464 RepID=UPI0023F1229C|nr:head-tail adaptor protein [Enterobacter oligotrophicus]
MTEPLDPGKMRSRLLFGYLEERRGSLGEVLPSEPVHAGRAWAMMEPISNRKIRTADQRQVVETCQFTLYPRAVEIDWTVTTGGKVFTVRSVDRSIPDRIIITAEADSRHDRAGN